jgi:putative transposase
MQYPYRKHPRLKNYDYSQNGAYFVTICTRDKQRILCDICVGRADHSPPRIRLSETGLIVDTLIQNIEQVYSGVITPIYVVMPNHIHLLLVFTNSPDGGMRSSRPTLLTMIRSLKTLTTKKIGCQIWQDSFHDHIIRNEEDYQRIWQYIDTNPVKWVRDIYYK